MAAPWNPPVKAEDFEFVIGLVDPTTGDIILSPTLASGDFMISKDHGSFANMGTLPTVSPSASGAVKFVLSSTEMDADKIVVRIVDQTNPKEWKDQMITILTVAAS